MKRKSTNCSPKQVYCSNGESWLKTQRIVIIYFFFSDYEGNAHFTFVKAGYYRNRRQMMLFDHGGDKIKRESVRRIWQVVIASRTSVPHLRLTVHKTVVYLVIQTLTLSLLITLGVGQQYTMLKIQIKPLYLWKNIKLLVDIRISLNLTILE